MADWGITSTVGNIMKYVKKYGISGVLLAFVLIALLVWALSSASTIDRIINESLDHRAESSIQAEIEALDQRAAVQEDIYKILHDLIDDTGADRAFVMEMHNGTNNTAGLPFMYGEMTYEEVKHGRQPVAEDWGKLTLTLYTFPLVIMKNGFWCGTLDDLKAVDNKIGLKAEANDVKYMVIARLNGVRENCLGALGITFVERDEPEYFDKVRSSMIATGQKVAILLDTAIAEK